MMNPVTLNIQSLKYQTFTLSGCKDIGIQKLMFVAKTQFLIVFSKLQRIQIDIRGVNTFHEFY